jgi:hypothetical protein
LEEFVCALWRRGEDGWMFILELSLRTAFRR